MEISLHICTSCCLFVFCYGACARSRAERRGAVWPCVCVKLMLFCELLAISLVVVLEVSVSLAVTSPSSLATLAVTTFFGRPRFLACLLIAFRVLRGLPHRLASTVAAAAASTLAVTSVSCDGSVDDFSWSS